MRPTPCLRVVRLAAVLGGGLVLLLAGCGPIVRYDDRGRATTVSWYRGAGFQSLNEREPAATGAADRRGDAGEALRGGVRDRARAGAAAGARADAASGRGSSLVAPSRATARATVPGRPGPGAAPGRRAPDPPRARVRGLDPAAAARQRGPAAAAGTGDDGAIGHDARTAAAPRAGRGPGAAPGDGASAELLGPAGSVHLVAADPALVELATGVAAQRAVLDPLLGAPAGPAALVGLDVPAHARVAAWVSDADELAAATAAAGTGVVVRFGGPMPHEIDGGVVGRLRARGWLALEVRTTGDDPGRLAEAVAAAHAAVDALGGTDRPRPLVLLGFGTDGREQALAVLDRSVTRPAAVVLVSEPGTDAVSVQRLEHALRSAPVPVLHLRPAAAVGERASVRALVTRGGLDDEEAARTGVTGWTYARRPAPGVAWLPMLVEPVADWVGRASGTPVAAPAASPAPAPRPSEDEGTRVPADTWTVDGMP